MRSNKLKFMFVLFCFVAVGLASCGTKTVGEAIDDSIIATKIESALIADPTTSAIDIDITVNNGHVRLTGSVDSEFERDRAEAIARSIDGVNSIDNDLVIIDLTN